MAKNSKQYAERAETHIEDSAEEAQESNGSVTQKRVYKGTKEVDHDLFKLMVAPMKKNVNYHEDQDPIFEYFEHTHIFHTVDSQGRQQNTCAPVGGHFHNVKVIPAKSADELPTLEVSKPMVWIMQKKGNRRVRVAVEHEHDKHQHAVEYRGSMRIRLRELDAEATKAVSQMQSVLNPPKVEGVM